MALTDDQRAMLRLLAQREEGYAEMAALMGISVEEVRARVKEALAEVDQTGTPEEPAEPSQPPPPEPSPPPTPPAPPRPPAEPTPTPGTEAEPPSPAPPSTTEPAVPRHPRLKRPSVPSRLGLPKDRGALIGLGAGVLALLVLAIVLIVGGGDSGSDTDTTATSGGEATTAPTSNPNLTEAILVPTNGGDASGRALFGRFRKNVLLQIEAEGLDPAPAGQSYTAWLYRSPKIALRIGSVPERGGSIAAQLQIPPQLLAYVANGAFDQIDLSLTSDADYKAALAKAKSEQTLPPYIGESVLRGEITGPAIKEQ